MLYYGSSIHLLPILLESSLEDSGIFEFCFNVVYISIPLPISS